MIKKLYLEENEACQRAKAKIVNAGIRNAPSFSGFFGQKLGARISNNTIDEQTVRKQLKAERRSFLFLMCIFVLILIILLII